MEASDPPAPTTNTGPRKFFVAGVEVEFPVKPYKCQISTMNMVIRGLRHMTNTLIESPTGSGKTLSLICSSLAWQRAEYAHMKDVLEKEAIENAAAKFEEEKLQQMKEEQDKMQRKQSQKEEETLQARRKADEGRVIVYYDDSEDEMEDFQMHPKKIVKMMKSMKGSSNVVRTSSDSLTHNPDSAHATQQELKHSSALPYPSFKNGLCQSPCSVTHKEELPTQTDEAPDTSAQSKVTSDPIWLSLQDGFKKSEEVTCSTKPQVPKIFYCSRTHQQIQQVVRELRKTVYKDVKMTILSSREHTCIQTPWRGHSFRNKTEMCCALLDPIEGPGCIYKNARMSSHTALESCNLESPWDLEDLVQEGRRVKCCPYFASRDLIATADIVFCPYVYLIDPKIRNTMNLQLRGAVILLDEAHNIEDCCRDAGSYSVLYDDIFQSMKDCKRVASMELLPEVHNNLALFLNNLMKWMSQKIHGAQQHQTDREQAEAGTLGGVNAVASFEEHDINMESIMEFKRNVMEAVAETNNEDNMQYTKESFERHGILRATTFVLEGLSLVFGFMYDNNMQHIWDYYVVVCKNSVVGSAAKNELLSDWKKASGRSRLIVEEDVPHLNWGHYLNFLCMNPGVVFRPVADVVRSIVLTSGTLAPLVTFNSELGTNFTNEMQALHIIDENQLWVGAIGSGPRGKELQASYRLTEMIDFRHELGNTILEVCKVIPYGVLCFLPSYGLLEALRQHWLTSGIWDELEVYKEVLCEMRGNKDFLPTIQAYYSSVRQCELGMGKGPLLFAIMRGKVSEGLDFADNRARGVITVGIPYPHLLDIQVGLKKKYNDANMKRGLKSGSEWYETQAYRALNQALGRCIRHRNDWGALIIIDKRFLTEERHLQGLSKWIRRKMQLFPTFEKLHSSLRNFVHYRNPMVPEHVAE